MALRQVIKVVAVLWALTWLVAFVTPMGPHSQLIVVFGGLNVFWIFALIALAIAHQAAPRD